MSVIIILILFVLMWIVLIVPRQREVRRHQALVASLAVGDEVMSSSGIYGTIRALEADHLDLEVAPGIVLRMAKRAVAAKVPPPEGDASLRAALGGDDEVTGPPQVGDGGAVEAGGAQDGVGTEPDGPGADEPRPGWPTEGPGS